MHARALLGQVDREDLAGGVRVEQPLRQRLDRSGASALTHADEQRAAAEDEHVAPFQPRRAVHAVAPHLLAGTGEQRMAAVDRAHVQGLAPARRVGHVVDADAAVDPARGVAREEVVGQRREHEGQPVDRGGEPGGRERELVERDAADEHLRQALGRELVHPAAQALAQPRTEVDVAQRAFQYGAAHAVDRQRLGQQLLEVEDLDAPPAQGVGEGVVLLARAADPRQVVEEQLVLVGRRQTPQLEVGAVEDDTPQRADLRAHVQASDGRGGGDRAHAIASSRPCAASTCARADASGIASCAVSRPRHHIMST
jgi:hypothetical protein